MHATTLTALPSALKALLFVCVMGGAALHATPRGRKGGRTYSVRGTHVTTLYRHVRGRWRAVKTY